MAVEFTGGVRSYFDREVSNVYDETVAAKRSEGLKKRFHIGHRGHLAKSRERSPSRGSSSASAA